MAELEVGMTATGQTVERGTTPEPFTATILGVIDDGIAPGLDMIIADTTSPAIDRAGGIWAGMSGSPVYAPDGRLIGAVAYGLAPSPIAGITPAADMLQVLDRPSSVPAVESAEQVRLPAAIRDRVVSTTEATAAEAAAGMRRLPLPVTVSGLSSGRLDQLSERLGDRVPDIRLVSAGSSTGTGSPADIFPGSNFAGAASYGDLSFTGVGTTTAVCDGVALAFGHPFFHLGATTLSAHPANAIFVQRDDLFGSFKVANVLGVVGTVDQDRLAAIRGVLGAGPTSVPVTSTVVTADGGSRDGLTQVSLPLLLPDLAAEHLLVNMDRTLDQLTGGTSTVRWVVDGRRASGSPFRLDVTNQYASQGDISFESIFESADQMFALQNNEFENVTITGVDYDVQASGEFGQYSISAILVRQPDGSYQPAPTDEALQVATGSRLNLRVVLTPYQNVGATRNVDLSVVVPSGMAGAFGTLDVIGGPTFEEEPEAPGSFDELLAELQGVVPNNAVSANLTLERETDTGVTTRQTSDRELADQVVVGEGSFPVEVVAAPRAFPAVVDGGTWKLRSSLSGGSPSRTFSFGNGGHQKLMCDTNGDGRTEPALFREGIWQVRTSLTGGALPSFRFGRTGDIPVCGDWNGDGRDEIGVYRAGRWLLRTGIASGAVGWDFGFGSAGWQPVVGDWNGDGVDTVGVFRSGGQWQVRNDNSAGSPSASFTYGTASGDRPLVGDWNRDGRDTPGLYRGGTWLYRNSLTSGSSTSFTYGGSSSRAVPWQ